jgi:hypothetical protein
LEVVSVLKPADVVQPSKDAALKTAIRVSTQKQQPQVAVGQ